MAGLMSMLSCAEVVDQNVTLLLLSVAPQDKVSNCYRLRTTAHACIAMQYFAPGRRVRLLKIALLLYLEVIQNLKACKTFLTL